jgi:hypothetical protein
MLETVESAKATQFAAAILLHSICTQLHGDRRRHEPSKEKRRLDKTRGLCRPASTAVGFLIIKSPLLYRLSYRVKNQSW